MLMLFMPPVLQTTLYSFVLLGYAPVMTATGRNQHQSTLVTNAVRPQLNPDVD